MNEAFLTRNIVAADAGTTVVIRTKDDGSPGILSHVTINKASAQALALYKGIDPTAPTAELIGTLKASAVEQTYWYKAGTNKGLSVIVPSSYTGDATISYN